MSFLFAGYLAFFVLLGGYIVRLLLLGARLERERERLSADRDTRGAAA